MVLTLVAACRHTPYTTVVDWVDDTPSISGIVVDGDRLLSYSTLPGETPSKPRDYAEILADGSVTIKGHRSDDAVVAFVAAECCGGQLSGKR
jgi:hypothetical protein